MEWRWNASGVVFRHHSKKSLEQTVKGIGEMGELMYEQKFKRPQSSHHFSDVGSDRAPFHQLPTVRAHLRAVSI